MPIREDSVNGDLPEWQDEPMTQSGKIKKTKRSYKTSRGRDYHVSGIQQDPLLFESNEIKTMVDESEDVPNDESKKSKCGLSKKGKVLLGCGGLALLALVIVLPVVLTVVLQEESVSQSAPAPSDMIQFEKPFVLEGLPTYTMKAVESDDASPQASAYRWVQNDPAVHTYSTDRLLQRFALATLYFATQGHGWNSTSCLSGDDDSSCMASTEMWLSYEKPECEWIQPTSSSSTVAAAANTKQDALKNSETDHHAYSNIRSLCGSNTNQARGNNGIALERRGNRGRGMMRRMGRRGGRKMMGKGKGGYGNGSRGYHYYDYDSYDSYDNDYYYSKSRMGMSYYYQDYYSADSYDDDYYRNRKRIRGRTLQKDTEPPEEKDNWDPVRFLHFPHNNLVGSLPPELSLLTDVESIDFAHNSLSGSIPSQIFSAMDKLTSLVLQDNYLSGQLPSEIGLWSNNLLKDIEWMEKGKQVAVGGFNVGGLVLNAAHNFLNHTIPSQLGTLSTMEKLNLADNRFSGPIMNLEALTNLQELLLYQNEFSGTLPKWIGQFTALRLLEVDNNKLTGLMQTPLANLKNLNRLLLYNNPWSPQTIPTEIGSLQSLNVLGWTSSQLSGTLPSELGLLSNLEHLWLYDNSLYGFIPTELGMLVKNGNMRLLMIHDNDFIGVVPPPLCLLEELQFDCASHLEDRLLCGCNCSCTFDNAEVGASKPPASDEPSAVTSSAGNVPTQAPIEEPRLTTLPSPTMSPTLTPRVEPTLHVSSDAPTSLVPITNATADGEAAPEGPLRDIPALNNQTASGTAVAETSLP